MQPRETTDLRAPNGKCYSESSRSPQHAIAKNLLKLREGDGAKGVPVTPLMARFTFDEAARDLEREYAANERNSLESVERRIRLHLLPFFGGRRMTGVTTSDIRSYTAHRRDEGAKNATINRELAALKRMFSLATKAGTIMVSPFIPMLEENNVGKGFFEREQFEAVCAALTPPVRAVVKFLYLNRLAGAERGPVAPMAAGGLCRGDRALGAGHYQERRREGFPV